MFTHTMHHTRDETCLTLVGELELPTRTHLKTAIAAALRSGQTVRVDLDAVTSIDVVCLGVLLAARAEARIAGRSLVLVNAHGWVRQIMRYVGVLSDTPEPGAD